MQKVMETRKFMMTQEHLVGAVKVYHVNMSTSHKTKHIADRYFFIKKKIDKGEVEVEYTPSLQMLANMFTKPLQGELFRVVRTKVHWFYLIYCMGSSNY